MSGLPRRGVGGAREAAVALPAAPAPGCLPPGGRGEKEEEKLFRLPGGGGKEARGAPAGGGEEEEQQPLTAAAPPTPARPPEGERGGSRPAGRGEAALGPGPARAPRLFPGKKFRQGPLRGRRLPEEDARRRPSSARASPGTAVAERRGRGTAAAAAAGVRGPGGQSLAGGGLPRPWSRSTRSCSPSAARAWRRP